jgi:hypothetical protein
MKATELRIGNYVLRSGHIEKVYQIRNSGVDFYRGQNKKSIITQSYTYSGIEPIPLTEEWLLKFGFKYYSLPSENNVKRGYYTMKYGSTFKIIISNKKYYFLNFRKEIEYAHQLQNLYFALTGEELTIKL